MKDNARTPFLLVDDRGMSRELLIGRGDFGTEQARARPMLYRRARELISSFASPQAAGLAFFLATMALVPLYVWMTMRNLSPVTGTVGLYALLVVLISASIVGARVGGRRRFERKSREYVAIVAGYGACPACGYAIASLPHGDDGCVACPECGAAWRSDRIRRSSSQSSESHLDHATAQSSWERFIGLLRLEPKPVQMGDDRARKVSVGGAVLRESLLLASGESHRARIEAARRLVRAAGADKRWAFSCAGVLFSLAMLVGFFAKSFSWSAMPGILMAGYFLAASIAAFLSDWGASGPEIREILLKDELCPSCMEDLRGVEPDEFGLTECPMCTAAWRVSAFVKAKNAKDEAG